MFTFDYKKTFVNGLFLALPALAMLYFGKKTIHTIEKIIDPLANKCGVQHLLGELTLTLFAFATLLILIFILGLLLHFRMLRNLNIQIESIAYKLVPQLYKFKAMAMDIDEDDNFPDKNWEHILLLEGDSWIPAYITEVNEQWLSVFIPNAPEGKSGSVKSILLSTAQYKIIKGKKLNSILHHYGQGLID